MAALAGHELTIDATMQQLLGGLREETNGNPFFALEILRYLASTGDVLQTASGRWEPRVGLDLAELPESVREVVAARVAAVGPEVTATLATAALIGNEFGLGLLARVLDTDEELVLDVLERAEPARIVTFVADDRFAFSHALIANSLAQDLSELRRATLHRRIAEELEHRPVADRNAGELAGHWLAARGPDAHERALHYAQLAGDRALAGLAPDDALPWYRTALELVGDDDPARRVGLLIGLGDALRQLGDASHREVLLEAGRKAAALGLDDAVVRAALANFRGWASQAGAVDRERVALLEAALAAAGSGRTATRARLLSVLAAELAFSDDLERRRALCDEALAIARELDDPRTLGQVLSCRFDAVRVPATAEERDRSTTENLALTETFDDPIAHWFAVTDRLTVAAELGLRDDVERYLTEEVELADELQAYQRWIALVHRTWHALVTGRFAECESLGDQGLQVGTETGQPDAFVLYASGLFLLRDVQGRWDELLPAIEQSIAENPDIAGFRACLAQSYAGTGRHDDALRMLRAEAATAWDSVPRDVVWATALALFGNVAATIGATEEAPALLDLLAPYVHLVATDGAHVYQPIALVAGRLATLLGRPEADPWLRQAEDLARRFDAPVWLAEALLARSELTADRGPAELALATVERLGPTAVGHRIRRHLGLA